MPLKNGRLTRGETAFIEAYDKTQDRAKAEKIANLRPNAGYEILARPEIQRQIVARQVARLTDEALPLAVDTVISVMTNTKAPAAARVTAAKVVFDRVLPDQNAGPDGKEPHEMTPDELAARIHALTKAAGDKARDVTPNDDATPFD